MNKRLDICKILINATQIMNRDAVLRLFLMLCFVITLVHIFYLCNEYFRYEVTTFVEIAIPQTIQFPGLTFCSRLNFLNRENLGKPADHLFSYISKGNVTASFVMNSTQSFADLIRFSIITRLVTHPYNDGYFNGDESNGWFPLMLRKSYILDSSKCFHVCLRDDLNQWIDYQQLYTVTKGGNNLISWYFKNYRGFILYYIGVKDATITELDFQMVILPNTNVYTTFSTYESFLKEPPYQSWCRNYEEQGFASKNHCRQDCFRKTLLKKHNMSLLQSLSYSDDSVFIRDASDVFNDTKSQQIDIYRYCDTQCFDAACHSVTYTQNLIHRQSTPGSSSITTTASKNPATKTQAQPAIPFVSFFSNLLSTFGTWLGLSAYGMFALTTKVIESLKSHFASNHQDNHQGHEIFVDGSRKKCLLTQRKQKQVLNRNDYLMKISDAHLNTTVRILGNNGHWRRIIVGPQS